MFLPDIDKEDRDSSPGQLWIDQMNWTASQVIRPIAKICVGIIALGMLYFAPVDARADLRICNDTKSLVGAALGFRKEGKWFTEGWWQIPGQTCASIVEGALNSRFYYIYAEDSDKGGQWRGDIFMCTSDKEFKIEGIKDCFARGHEKTGFFEVDTGDKQSWMIRLTETGQTGSAE